MARQVAWTADVWIFQDSSGNGRGVRILLLNPTPGNLLQIIPSQAPPTDAISCPYRKLPVKKPKFSERKSLCSPISREECGEIVGIYLVFVRKMIGYLLKISYNSAKSGEFLL